MYVIIRDADDYDYSGPKGNIVNISRRRCRIGKVTLKTPKHWLRGDLDVAKPIKPNPWMPLPSPFWSGGYVPVTSSGDVPIVPSHGVC